MSNSLCLSIHCSVTIDVRLGDRKKRLSVNVLPWMLCGTNEIGEATAKKMETARLVVWAQHGIYGAGKDLDETSGLIETAEKAAEIWLKIAHLPLVNTITDEAMHQLEVRFGVKAREGYLQ